MSPPFRLDRRTLLRGAAGTLLGLPLLEAMLPARAHAQSMAAPKRIVFFVWGTGTPDFEGHYGGREGCFWPTTQGRNYETTAILEPLADLKNDLLLLKGLSNGIGRDTVPAQLGDHHSAVVSLLTGTFVGNDLRANISVDQMAANTLRQFTPGLPSLFMNALYEPNSYANVSWLSWSGPTSPRFPIQNSRDAFQQVFGDVNTDELTRQKRLAYKKSVLHWANGDATRLKGRLGRADQQRLDQYLESVRSLESRIAVSANACSPGNEPSDPGYDGRPERSDQMIDLLVHAFACDRTRVATFMHGQTGLYSRFPWLSSPTNGWEFHGEISHGTGAANTAERAQRMDAYVEVTRWHVGQFGKLVRKLKNTPEGDGSGASLLDNTLVIGTSEMAYGDGHFLDPVPVILAGRCGGAVNPGRFVRMPASVPISNLYVSALNAVGVPTTSFGNSDGAVALT